jgi:hypothetical protein
MFRRPVVMRRGPGLLGAVALGGVAYTAGRAGAAAAAQQAADPPPQPQQVYAAAAPDQAPPPEAPSNADRIAQLQDLGKLRDSGVLTPEEFEREKQRVLRSA